MKHFEEIICKNSIADLRSAFYYLSRFLKQASISDEYNKDFFEDDSPFVPSERVKSLTADMITIIESFQGKKTSLFTDDEVLYWMDSINDAESNLDPVLTPDKKAKVEIIISDLPTTSDIKNQIK
jgi:hypothetical protein